MNRNRRGKRGRRTDTKRAVIDIGSNTVRMVIYSGAERSPVVIWNEKVAARLGRDLSDTGKIPGAAEKEALGALARYALIIQDLEIDDVQTVATAAARDASNGAAFLKKVEKLGFAPRLLSGEEEAVSSAMGAIGAFPDARGVVADLGGGSLEMVSIAKNAAHDAISLPFGTLRLPALRKQGRFAKKVTGKLEDAGLDKRGRHPLFMVGGTWRAFAAYAMNAIDYPLTDPHGFELEPDEAARLARKLVRSKPEQLAGLRGISPMRASYLPNAAALLLPMLETVKPARLIFSSWGIREGLLYARLTDLHRRKDPLLAGVDAFAAPLNSSITDAARLAAWSVELAQGDGSVNERIRLAAAQLAVALHRVEPNLRVNHATEWALDKRWVGLDAQGRAMIAAALFGSLGRTELPGSLRRLASDEELREGQTWGLGFRLGHRLGAASRVSMLTSALARRKRKLILRLDESRQALANYPVTKDLEVLADWLDLEPKIKIGKFDLEDEPEGWFDSPLRKS
ncbi:Ppx/GppA family phosphatase [Qipengyuania sp. DGS5-3]|uniref:Ppx/GppA phosphatase family protein n=1 Tax=Qipengyuania sp. DGS5-3 TaxID=3349632 RepID=UPI0036D31431